MLVALAYGAAFGIMTLALAVNAAPGGAPIVPYLGLFSSLLMFFNSGFSPLSAYPEWLQPIVANQPMTPAIDLMRALAVGGSDGREPAQGEHLDRDVAGVVDLSRASRIPEGRDRSVRPSAADRSGRLTC